MKLFLIGIVTIILGASITYLLLINSTRKVANQPPEKSVSINTTHFSLISPPSDSLIGSISSLSGEVKWQSRIATEAAVITTPRSISQGESLITGNKSTVSVVFKNSCIITLSPKTEINIIQTLSATLLFEQKSGTAEYSNSCSLPLSVRSGSLILQKTEGVMKVTESVEDSRVTVLNLSGTVTAGYNDLRSTTTTVSIPSMRSYVFDTESKSGVLKKLVTADY